MRERDRETVGREVSSNTVMMLNDAVSKADLVGVMMAFAQPASPHPSPHPPPLPPPGRERAVIDPEHTCLASEPLSSHSLEAIT